MLHACDISNPTKELFYYHSWTQRVLTEYFAQGDMEKARGMPVAV